jgi:hypothetical protein
VLWLAALLVMVGAVSIFALVEALDLVGGPEERRGQAGGPTQQATPEATPAATPSPPPLDPQWTVLLPDPAGGLPLARSGGSELPHRESAMQQAGIPVTNLVGGQYGMPDGSVAIDFFGGELEAAPGGSGQETLEATFRANFPNLTPAGPAREYEPGELGGEVWCVSYTEAASSACGWVDEWTIGYVFALNTDQADSADWLLRLRADTETEPAG